MPGSINVGGTYRKIAKASCKINGSWHEIKDGWARKDGAWTKIYSSGPIMQGTFGVRVNRSNSSPNGAVEYIDDATDFTPMTRNSPGSWANIGLVTGIKPVLRKSNGQWQDLDKRNLANGADISSLGNDVFTRFPTWYLSITTDGTYDYIRFCDKQKDSTYFDLASLYNGSRKGMFHIGCYHAYNSGGGLYSSVNKKPTVNISTRQFHQYAQARGPGFDQIGYYQVMYLQALFLVLFKGRNGQELIGKGYVTPSTPIVIVTEDRTTYDNDYGMAGSSSGSEQMSFFWVNNFWGNVLDFVGGARTDGSRVLMTLDGGQPINTNRGGWTTQNSTGAGGGGCINSMDLKSTKIGFFPKYHRLSSGYYEDWCDYSTIKESKYLMYATFGGGGVKGEYNGPFRLVFEMRDSSPSTTAGSRLVYREAVN